MQYIRQQKHFGHCEIISSSRTTCTFQQYTMKSESRTRNDITDKPVGHEQFRRWGSKCGTKGNLSEIRLKILARSAYQLGKGLKEARSMQWMEKPIECLECKIGPHISI